MKNYKFLLYLPSQTAEGKKCYTCQLHSLWSIPLILLRHFCSVFIYSSQLFTSTTKTVQPTSSSHSTAVRLTVLQSSLYTRNNLQTTKAKRALTKALIKYSESQKQTFNSSKVCLSIFIYPRFQWDSISSRKRTQFFSFFFLSHNSRSWDLKNYMLR